MSTNQSYLTLNNTVITNGYCVGCGACAVPENSPFIMVMDEYGQYQSRLSDPNVFAKTENDFEKLCPFGATAPNEDEIAIKFFSGNCDYNSDVGYYKGIFAGHVAEGEFRKRGSSGGMGTWVLNELLTQGLVDYVLHVRADGDGREESLNMLPFRYHVSGSAEETQKGGKSRYYPIELSEVLKTVRTQPGRYAIVGLPCFIKSVRLLQAQDPLLAERIRYCVGLVCGHLKSAHYGESLAWQMGVVPSELKAIDFRIKDQAQPANRYNTYARGASEEKTVPTNQLFGTNWGAGAFKYKACDFCDDVFAETADVVLGDAWLPEYVQDSYGTNLIVTRNDEIQRLIESASSEGRLQLDDLAMEKAVQSQNAGLRHRKGAIGYRLYCEQAVNSWVPTKRVSATKTLKPRFEMKRQRLRTELRDLSHQSFANAKREKDLSKYIDAVEPVYIHYSRQGRSVIRRLFFLVKRILKTVAGLRAH